MSTFYGGTPPISFNNDDLYALKVALENATSPVPPQPEPGPTVPPPSGEYPPPGFIPYDLPWVSTTSATRIILPFTCEKQYCIRFTPTQVGTNGSISMAEYGSQRVQRKANISWVPGDFAGGYGVWPYNGQQGTTLNWSLNAYPYGSTVPQDPWIMPIEVGRTYYLNLMNMGCSPGEDTTMFLDLRIPA